ncbi:endonuclease/exonuclease/phosphatase family protein [Facilibium subflavum]|uniref:endonuclease/exonuclease/phosphatase family protein n=1 Tax=Facilibium subflavum TaxID=2219058 RepID=UPI000E64FB54|nr:endonuclease/exonuclease/phosphatase family protein [Facilibium subflavum]
MRKFIRYSWLIISFIWFNSTFAHHITVMTYNTNLLPNIPISDLTKNLNHPFKRAYYIPNALDHYKPDIVAFQEDIAPVSFVILNAQMRKHGYPYHSKVVGMPSLKHLNLLSGGVIIYSKYPFSQKPQYAVFSRSLGLEGIANKGAVFTQITKNNKRYNIISLHTQSFSQPIKAKEYDRWRIQIGQLSQFIANLQIPANQAVIIMGDFNADSGKAITAENPQIVFNSPYQYLLNSLKAQPAGIYSKDTLPYSYDSKTNKMVTSKEQTTLDHILCMVDYQCPDKRSSLKIIALHNKHIGDITDLSDHYALIGSLYYP